MRLTVDASRHPADHHEAHSGQLATEHASDMAAIRRARACADDRHGRPGEHVEWRIAAHVETRRRIVDRAEQLWKGGLRAPHEAEARRGELRPLVPLVEAPQKGPEARARRPLQDVRASDGSVGRYRELAHVASSRGDR